MGDSIHIISAERELLPPNTKANNKALTGSITDMEPGMERASIIVNAYKIALNKLALMGIVWVHYAGLLTLYRSQTLNIHKTGI